MEEKQRVVNQIEINGNKISDARLVVETLNNYFKFNVGSMISLEKPSFLVHFTVHNVYVQKKNLFGKSSNYKSAYQIISVYLSRQENQTNKNK